ncbi:unnamed protein product [Ophioblennius macclurei]
MLKVTGSAMPGALAILPVTVIADAGDGDKGSGSGSGSSPLLLNRDELSLYAPPPPLRAPADRQAGHLEERVAAVREAAEPYTAWFRGTYGRIRPKVQNAVQFGSDAYAYLKNPPKDFYPRAGVIGFTGILGLFLARSSRIKRLIYPAGLMTVSASLYYPDKAAAIARSTGDSVYDGAVRGYAAVEKMVHPQSKAQKSTKDPEAKP